MHKVTTVESVSRTYMVADADGTEQSARDRLHLWFRDPELVRDGVVLREAGEEVHSRRIRNVEPIQASRLASDAAGDGSGENAAEPGESLG